MMDTWRPTAGQIRAHRLRYLELRDAEISAIQHEITTERQRNREEATRLRVGMARDEHDAYELLKLEEGLG